MKQSFSVTMRPERTTPGTYLYAVPSDKRMDAGVRNVYIQKEAFGQMSTPPGEVEVTITYDDGK